MTVIQFTFLRNFFQIKTRSINEPISYPSTPPYCQVQRFKYGTRCNGFWRSMAHPSVILQPIPKVTQLSFLISSDITIMCFSLCLKWRQILPVLKCNKSFKTWKIYFMKTKHSQLMSLIVFCFMLCIFVFCLYWLHTICMQCLPRPEDNIRSPVTIVTESCELSCGCWESRLGPLTEQLSHLKHWAISLFPQSINFEDGSAYIIV